MRARAALLLSVLIVACGSALPAATHPSPSAAARPPDRPTIILATTTSTQDSGLLDALIPSFESATGYRVKTTAVGTGAALALGAAGNADVLLVHAPSAELDYMNAGNGDKRLLVMHNDFVLASPPDDPARAAGRPVIEALRAIAASGSRFISRGDNSGTDILEKALFKQAGVTTDATWYIEAGTGMGQALTVASEKRAYIITDRATYLARRATIDLRIVVEGGRELLNIYHVITVSPTRFVKVNSAGAEAFAAYLVSDGGQRLIADYGKERYGQPLFFADAGENETDLR